jgi:hypothetical protein
MIDDFLKSTMVDQFQKGRQIEGLRHFYQIGLELNRLSGTKLSKGRQQYNGLYQKQHPVGRKASHRLIFFLPWQPKLVNFGCNLLKAKH